MRARPGAEETMKRPIAGFVCEIDSQEAFDESVRRNRYRDDASLAPLRLWPTPFLCAGPSIARGAPCAPVHGE